MPAALCRERLIHNADMDTYAGWGHLGWHEEPCCWGCVLEISWRGWRTASAALRVYSPARLQPCAAAANNAVDWGLTGSLPKAWACGGISMCVRSERSTTVNLQFTNTAALRWTVTYANLYALFLKTDRGRNVKEYDLKSVKAATSLLVGTYPLLPDQSKNKPGALKGLPCSASPHLAIDYDTLSTVGACEHVKILHMVSWIQNNLSKVQICLSTWYCSAAI